MWLKIKLLFVFAIIFYGAKMLTAQQKILFVGDSHIAEGTVAQTVAEHFHVDYELLAWNGASAKDFLEQDKIPKEKYRLCIVSLGTNWSKDTENYQKLIRKIRKYQPRMILTTPNQVYYNMDKMQIATHDIGKKLQIPVWDFYRYSKISRMLQNPKLTKPDRIHLTKAGYLLQGRLLCEFLETMNW